MLTLLKRLLSHFHGEPPETDERGERRARSSATSHLFSKDSPAMRQSADPAKSGDGDTPAKRARPRVNPDFDPYNTGKFDRGASWERISKKQR